MDKYDSFDWTLLITWVVLYGVALISLLIGRDRIAEASVLPLIFVTGWLGIRRIRKKKRRKT